MRLRSALRAAALLVALALLAASPVGAQEAPLEPGRTYQRWWQEGKTDSLLARFSPELRALVATPEVLAALRERLVTSYGAEVEVIEESGRREGAVLVYKRVSRFQNGAMALEIGSDPAGTILLFHPRPIGEAPSRFLDYQTKTPLRLPFEGEWTVFWGGRTRARNYHAGYPDQRFAYDLLVARGGQSFAGERGRNESFFCFGLPILAPGAGTVVAALDSLEDNVPGRMNPAVPPGNHVVLDHGNGEFSFLAHLRRGSVAVRAGERVEAGRKVGECGNSGNSSEPHLHYHLQTTAVFGEGEGLPAMFTDYLADGVPVERGEPVRGQKIRPR